MTYLLLVLQQFIASTTHLVAKSVTDDLHPTMVVLVRGLLTCVAFGIWIAIKRRNLPRVRKADYKIFLLLGLLNLPLNQLAFTWGVHYTAAPNAALAYALMPVFVVIMLVFTKKERAGWHRWLGVGLAMVGAAIVLVDKGASFSSEHMLGNMMVLAASISFAGYTVLGRDIVMRYGAIYATGLTFFSGIVIYAIVWFFIPVSADIAPLFDSELAPTIWMKLVFLGVVTSGLGYGLWYYALTHMETSRVAVFNNLQPILTTVLAFVVFGTEPTVAFVIGGVIALSGVVVTQRA